MSYQQGSFRGVKFRTTSMRTHVGQRRGIYELPYDSKGAASVNLGRKARRYAIEMLLIQNDYKRGAGFDEAAFDAARDALIAAVEQPGAGLLVHPTLGSVMVVPHDSIEITENTMEGGLVSIRFEATESRAEVTPAVTPSARSQLPQNAVSVHSAAQIDLTSNLKTAGYPAFIAFSSIAAIDNALTSLRNLNGFISAQLSVPGRIASEIDAIADQIVQLHNAPAQLYADLQSAMDVVFSAITKVASAALGDLDAGTSGAARVESRVSAGRAALLAASTDTAADIANAGTRDTPARAQERQNTAAIRNAVRAAHFASLANSINDLEFNSRTEANTLLTALLAKADQLLSDDALGAAVFDAVYETRSQLQTRLRNLSITASTTVTLDNEIPACILAWRLYGDADREDEIVARNDIAHPSFVPGASVLEVLIS